MSKRVKISLDTSNARSFAPGVDNVHLRENGIEYYAPDTFHISPFFDCITPVFASDVVRSRDLHDIYGYLGTRALNDNVVLLRNHPVRKLRLVGRITKYFVKDTSKERTFYFLTLDDSSGEEIICRVAKSNLLEAGLPSEQCEGYLIHITGLVRHYNGGREINVEFLEILESKSDPSLGIELMYWRDVIRARKVLQTPWFQTPLIDNGNNQLINTRMDPNALKRKLMQRNLKLFDDPEEEDISLVLDSQIYIRQKGLRKPQRDAKSDIDDTGSDTDLEEITKDVFESKKLLNIPMYGVPPKQFNSTNWISFKHPKHPYRVVNQYTEQELCIRLVRWMVSYPESKFPLEIPFQSNDISTFLLKMIHADNGISLHESDLDQTSQHLFNAGRRILCKIGLIRVSKSQKCSTRLLRIFYKDLNGTLERIRSMTTQKSPISLLIDNYISVFNHEHDTDIEVDINMLNRLIYTILKQQDDNRWKYNMERHEWAYEFMKSGERKLKAPRSR